ncbi:MAG: DNA topoisomerase IV subunit A, partial [Spirochaetales bacterium]
MAYVTKLFNDNFIEYASYVIKDRAIPHLEDGLKPVQRRILHSLFELDDGKFHKVANVVGHCMKYHPHGDASIYSSLVVLANRDYFIDKQGNFGNIFTGDEASAARYIECRALPLAKQVFYNPEITPYDPSYDGRNREPVTFPAKLPVVLIQGAEGIAVGMSTKILPHNFTEVLKAVISAIKGEDFILYPDFPTGGFMDVSEYADGMGKVLVRGKLDTKDPKKIIVRELPFGSTTQSLIASLEAAAKKNKIKISGISDFTTENVEIEIKLARGVHTHEVVDSLYAFTECQSSISVNLLVINDNKPVGMTVTEVVRYHANHLVEVLKAELKLEDGKLRDKLHARTLEQIFIEERIYKRIEEMTTQETVIKAVFDGFKPFQVKIKRRITEEDIETLLKIPIRRISRYDINRARKEMKEIVERLKVIKHHLANLKDYAVSFLNGILKEHGGKYKRLTKITSFEKINVREVAARNLELKYDEDT